MAVKRRGLGKGLDALLGTSSSPDSNGDTLKTLPVDLLQRGQFQPRKDFNKEAIQALADSITAQGIVQPIVVRTLTGQGKYEIVAGERRWRAAQLAGFQEVPVVIKDVPDQTAMCIALIENIQREDLNPLEEASALDQLLKKFEMTHDAVAEAVGRSRASVTNLLRLLALNSKVKRFVEAKKIGMGHARALLALPGNQQPEAAAMVVKQDLSVRATEALVRRIQDKGSHKKSGKKTIDPNIRQLQDGLSEQLAAKVEIAYSKSGKGQLKIHYSSLDQLDGILKRIK